MENPPVSSIRLKFGLVTMAVGCVLQLFLSASTGVDNSIADSVYFNCIQYRMGCENEARDPSSLGWWIAILGFLIVMGHLTGKLAAEKGRDYSSYFWVGFLFSFFGYLFVILMSDQSKASQQLSAVKNDDNNLKLCPFCAEQIQVAAVYCKHCNQSIEGKN